MIPACPALWLAALGWSPAMPVLMVLPGIIDAEILFGRGTGPYAATPSTLLGVVFFQGPAASLSLHRPAATLEVPTFLAIGVFTAILLEALHRAIAILTGERAGLAAALPGSAPPPRSAPRRSANPSTVPATTCSALRSRRG